MTDAPTISAWEDNPQPVDETEFTPWAEKGWNAWNGQSPEVEVCQFVQSLIEMMKPKLIVETGVGQGYMTRMIVPLLGEGQHLIAYESDDGWRSSMWALSFWTDNRFVAHIAEQRTPSPEEFASADLCVIDSEFVFRFREIELWDYYAKPGAVAIIHDTAERANTVHQSVRNLIISLGMTGVFLHNPRGCFMAVKSS